MEAEETCTIGQRRRAIREALGKSQAVIAGLAGIAESYLSMLENGQRPLDSIKLITALARALEIAPSELARLPLPAPGNGHTDSGIQDVRHALAAADQGAPGGLVLPADVLRDRVQRLQVARRACRFRDVRADLPEVTRDLHTTINAGRDVEDLLSLAVTLHVDVTRLWLRDAGASDDLRRMVTRLARDLAEEHGGDVVRAVAGFGAVTTLVSSGMLDLARIGLEAIDVPGVTSETVGLVGALTMAHPVVAAIDGRTGDVDAAMDAADELAARFGEVGEMPLGFGFGPTNVAVQRMTLALEAGDPDRAASLGEGVQPDRHPHRTRQATYWVDYGRALAQLARRYEDAVRALRTAEQIFPNRVYRNPLARETLAGLLRRSRGGHTAEELRGLAYRAGLIV